MPSRRPSWKRVLAAGAVALLISPAALLSATPASAADGSSTLPSGPNPLASGPALPTFSAAAEAQKTAEREGRTAVAKKLGIISAQPTAVWLGEWYDSSTLVRVLRAETQAAVRQKKTAVFVLYAIPARDCGQHSGGGLDPAGYARWVALIAQTLRGTPSVAIVEPDALAMLGECAGQGDRAGLIRDGVRTLAAAGVPAYIDAGNSGWIAPEVMAARLRDAGIADARGFATNVSGFRTTASERTYAERVRSALGGTARYVIDTSRNGRGWTGEWCNPPGAGLGSTPRAVSGAGGLDALLWIKRPGESDGDCNGGPAAGSWFEKAALDLVARRQT